MTKWLLAIIIVTVQEVVALNSLLLKTHQGLFTPWIIHLLFALMTAVGLVASYGVGKYIQRRFPHSKAVLFAKKWVAVLQSKLGKKGTLLPLAALSFFSFPYINGFVLAWLDVPFMPAFIFLLVVNMIGYAILYILIGGVVTLIPNPTLAFVVVIVISAVIILASKKFKV